jgi:hypothetical protein
MFHSSNVSALFKKGTLKLIQNEDGEWRRVAECTLVVEPLPVELARELGEEVASHLFTDEGRIREELESIDLRVRLGLQHVTARIDPDVERPAALISPVSVKDLSATRCEDKKTGREWITLSFVLVFSLEEKAARNFVLDRFGQALYWTFESMQRELEGIARTKEAAARLAKMGAEDGGDVTISIPGADPITLDKTDAARLRQEAADLRKGRAH